MFAWPTAQIRGDERRLQPANTLAEIKTQAYSSAKAKKVDEKAKKNSSDSPSNPPTITKTDPRYAAARLWVDAIIDPAHTRDALIWALNAASLNTHIAEFKTGVLQT